MFFVVAAATATANHAVPTGLDPGSADRDAPAETSMDVPLWLAHPLVKRSMAAIKVRVYHSREKVGLGVSRHWWE